MLTNIPKILVSVVVDQMKYEYVDRFWDEFGEKGIKKLVNEGIFCRNTHYNYIFTYTGPGHASIFTGTTPSVHGIIETTGIVEKIFHLYIVLVIGHHKQYAYVRSLMERLIQEVVKCRPFHYYATP